MPVYCDGPALLLWMEASQDQGLGPVLQHPLQARHRTGLHIGGGFEWEDSLREGHSA